MKKYNPQTVSEKIGIPLNDWAGNCYGIACQMLVHEVLEGRPCYGHYHGKIAPNTLFSDRPIVQHGWIETKDGYIIDPTRWVFENVEPYIFTNKKNLAKEYDEGGQRLLKLTMPPIPEHDSSKAICSIDDKKMAFLISSMLKRKNVQTQLTVMECHWLGKQPLDMLGDNAKDLYQFMIDKNQSAWIPLDNKLKVMEVDVITPLKKKLKK